MNDFKTSLLGCTENPQTLSVAGALGCFEEQSSGQLLDELNQLQEGNRKMKERGVLKNSFGRGHGSVGDQNCFVFSIENLPRAATLFLCSPEYLAHLQQSLRRAKASRGFHVPEAIGNSPHVQRVKEILLRSFSFYGEMCEAGIPAEDARYLLPLYTRTNIQTAGNARELCHLWQMAQGQGVPSVVKAVVEEMISLAQKKAPCLFEKFGFNFEPLAWYPAPHLFSLKNELICELIGRSEEGVTLVDSCHNLPITERNVERAVKEKDEAELANLKHVHFEFLVSMSLAAFHQAVRQRTWNHSVESIYEAADKTHAHARIVVPPSILRTNFVSSYQEQHLAMLETFRDLVKDGIPAQEAVGILPHSLKIFTLVHINGWNALHSIGKRTCVKAQWEIRGSAWRAAKIIKERFPVFEKWIGPQCITYGDCPEMKMQDCAYYQRLKRG